MKPTHSLAAALLLTLGIISCDLLPSGETSYNFGDPYTLHQSAEYPVQEGDSLFVWISYSGCGGETVSLEYSRTGSSSYEIWLHLEEREITCAAYIQEVRGFEIPDALKEVESIQLVTSGEERIVLRPAPPDVVDTTRFGYDYTVIEGTGMPAWRGDSLYVWLRYVCAASFTLRHARTDESSHELWLHNAGTLLACAVPVEEKRAFKVPDEIRDSEIVRFVTPEDERIELVHGDSIQFGDSYSLNESEGYPYLQGDSLHVWLYYTGCGGDAFSVEYSGTGPSSYDIWLYMEPRMARCEAAISEKGRAFEVPDEVRGAESIQLVTPREERIELKD